MINEVFGFKPLKEIGMLKCEATSSTPSSGTLVSRLQIGDRIEGVLVQEENDVVLKLDNGMKLSINLLSQIELGQLFSFVVVSKEGKQLVLKPELMEPPSNKHLIDQVISELKLPNDPVMKNIIGQFVAKGLSLDKESLLGIFQGFKTYDLPTEILVNLKSNETPIELKEMSQIADLKFKGIKVILDELDALVGQIKDSSQLEKLAHDLGNTVPTEVLPKIIKDTLAHQVVSKQFEESHLVEEALKKWFLSEFTENELQSKMNHMSVPEKEFFYTRILRNLLGALLKEHLEVDITQIKQDLKQSEKIISTSSRLEEVIRQFEKLKDSDIREDQLQHIKETLQFIQKYTVKAEYFYFPFVLNEKQGSGELYFFRPKKKKGNTNEKMYLVMGLDMPSLKKVEVHIEYIQDVINMALKVENEVVKKLIEDRINELHEVLKNSGYALNQLRVSLLKESKVLDKIDIGLYHMDFKV